MSFREVVTPEVDGESQRAAVIMVPYIELLEYRKLYPVLVPLLEQEFKCYVFLVAYRRILRREKKGERLLKQKRPMSRTLTAVHAAYLSDVVWPYRIVGQHSVHSLGCTAPTHKIFLDPKVREATAEKLPVFKAVYKALTGKESWFDYFVLPQGTPYEQQRCPNVYPLGFPPAPLFPPSPADAAATALPAAAAADTEALEPPRAPQTASPLPMDS